jgi:hypothetical protein
MGERYLLIIHILLAFTTHHSIMTLKSMLFAIRPHRRPSTILLATGSLSPTKHPFFFSPSVPSFPPFLTPGPPAKIQLLEGERHDSAAQLFCPGTVVGIRGMGTTASPRGKMRTRDTGIVPSLIFRHTRSRGSGCRDRNPCVVPPVMSKLLEKVPT